MTSLGQSIPYPNQVAVSNRRLGGGWEPFFDTLRFVGALLPMHLCPSDSGGTPQPMRFKARLCAYDLMEISFFPVNTQLQ